ncbi:hypothetical protein LIER_41957 [Lithospermum erythrorhizon]|uniref:Uncharacterized protein n=1 Tax=Lithospermum erythrorhizon TaxID=34254 RepID=A0AAV3RHE5_LITER
MGFFSGTYLAKDDDDDDEAYDHIGGENSNTDRIITLFMKIVGYHCFNFVPWLYSIWFYQPERGQILLGYIIVICSMLGKTVVLCRDMYFIIMDEIKKVTRKILIREYMSECDCAESRIYS